MEEFEIEFNEDDNGTVKEIVFRGDLVLTNQHRVKEALSGLDASACSQLKISLTDPLEIDLSFLQILFSFIKKMESRGVDCIIDWPDDAELMNLLERSGLSGIFKL